jgi:hypothetical protein
MTPLTDQAILLLRLSLGIVGAIGSMAGNFLAQNMPDGMPRSITEYGFAGAFIFFLIACLKILWDSKKADATAAIEREEKLNERVALLEKEMRDGLHNDLRNAEASRQEMINVLRQKSP